MSTEDLERHWEAPAGHKRVWPPITIVAGVVCSIAAKVWIEALEPSVGPTLTIEFGDGALLLIAVAVVAGTLLGVRTLWALQVTFAAVGTAVTLASAFQDPQAQTIGGLLLFIASAVFLLLPSSARFEQRRVRVTLD